MAKSKLKLLLEDFTNDLVVGGIIPSTRGGEPLTVLALYQLKIDLLRAINDHNSRMKTHFPVLNVSEIAPHSHSAEITDTRDEWGRA